MYKIVKKKLLFSPLEREGFIRVFIPEIIDINNKTKRYPVIYMHDGQNIYDEETSSFNMSWKVHRTIMSFIQQKLTEGIIVVGIDNSGDFAGRFDEYSPWKNDNLAKFKTTFGLTEAGGNGDNYAKFIVETLIPYIESRYPVSTERDNRVIAGSSMGGIISLYIGLKYQDIFSKIMSFSTAGWFAEKELNEFIIKQGQQKEMKIYLDIGDKETSDDTVKEFPQIYIDSSKKLYETLLSAGFQKDNLLHILDKGAKHNELSWAKRFPEALKWIFNLRNGA